MMSAAKATAWYSVAVLLTAGVFAASLAAGPTANRPFLVLFGLAILLGAVGAMRGSVHKRLDEQIHFQSQILEQVNDAVVAIDRNKRVIYWGRGAEAGLGGPGPVPDRRRAEREPAAGGARVRPALPPLDRAVFPRERELRYTWVSQPQLPPPDGVIGKTDRDMLEELPLPPIEKVI